MDKFSGQLATFLRGDINASTKNKSRAAILTAMISRLELTRVNIDHFTYHHFTGGGSSDSDLDVLLYGVVTACPNISSSISANFAIL